MCQYAAALGIAKKLNITFVIDPSRKYSFSNVNLQRIFKITHLGNIPDRKHMKWLRYEERKPSIYGDEWKGLPKGRNIILWGFFQSVRYFEDIQNEIRNEFTFIDSIQEQADSLLTRTLISRPDTITVGIHIRRGDKAHSPTNIEPTAYFKVSMDYMRQKYGKVTFLVATDSRDWALKTDLLPGDDVVILEEASGEVSI